VEVNYLWSGLPCRRHIAWPEHSLANETVIELSKPELGGSIVALTQINSLARGIESDSRKVDEGVIVSEAFGMFVLVTQRSHHSIQQQRARITPRQGCADISTKIDNRAQAGQLILQFLSAS
jgi:hypothetical protein